MCQSQWLALTEGKQDAEKLCEGDASTAAMVPGLDDEEERPAVEKPAERAEATRAGRRTGRPARGIMAASSP